MGPPLAEILKNCKAETGLEPPQPPVFKKIAKSAKPPLGGRRACPDGRAGPLNQVTASIATLWRAVRRTCRHA